VARARDAETAVRRAIVSVCRRLYDGGLIAGSEGNVSVKVDALRILITPAGVPKADRRPADLVVIDGAGRPLGGRRNPSTEVAMHVRVYGRRPGVQAVVHAHPPVATGFAVAGESFAAPVLPEVIVALGPVAVVPYATPGTSTLADAMGPALEGHDVFLLANHGATTLGPSLAVAYARMESLEHSARILLAARLLGQVRTLTAQQVRDLAAPRDGAARRPPPAGGAPGGDGLETE
jgi:L-fuculose-phosphate aldolase